MVKVVTAPNEIYTVDTRNMKKIFLAGSITGTEDWQSKVIQLFYKCLTTKDYLIYNPRREYFDITNKNIEEEQIVWEFEHLKISDIITFYFSPETLAPITLYELGRWGSNQNNKNIFICIHPDYQRKNDVIIQSKLNGFRDVFIEPSVEDFFEKIVIPNLNFSPVY